jgi:hypothetical protein
MVDGPLPLGSIAETRQIIVPILNTADADCLQKTLRTFWRTIQSSQADIIRDNPGMSLEAKLVMFSPDAPLYADQIYQCTCTYY